MFDIKINQCQDLNREPLVSQPLPHNFNCKCVSIGGTNNVILVVTLKSVVFRDKLKNLFLSICSVEARNYDRRRIRFLLFEKDNSKDMQIVNWFDWHKSTKGQFDLMETLTDKKYFYYIFWLLAMNKNVLVNNEMWPHVVRLENLWACKPTYMSSLHPITLKVHPDFHRPNIFTTNFHKFHWPNLTYFLQWLHLSNLCCDSKAQDCMQVLRL